MALSPAWPLEESRVGTGRRPWVGHARVRLASNAPAEASESCAPAVHAPRRWGRSAEAVAHLGDRLCQVWRRFRGCCTPRTRAPSARADDERRAPLPMAPARNLATLDRPWHGGDGQALPHGLSPSPWSGPAVGDPMHAASKATPALSHGRPWRLAARAAAPAGPHHAGAARPDHGRRGKGAGGRGAPCLTSAHGARWTRVEGARCWPPEGWGAACAPPRPGHAPGSSMRDNDRPGLEDGQAGQGPGRARCPGGLGRAVWAGEPIARRLGGRKRPVCGAGACGDRGGAERAARGEGRLTAR
jgi:hypothetical protein